MIDGPHELSIDHHHPGRLRMRSRAFEGAAGAERSAAASASVRVFDGVHDVRTNAQTGSMLVLYDPERVRSDALIGAIRHGSGLDVESARGRPGDEDRLAYVAIDFVRNVNQLVKDFTHHRADLRVLVPATLAGLAVWSGVREGVRPPPWDNLLYWSYSTFMALNDRTIARRPTDDDDRPTRLPR